MKQKAPQQNSKTQENIVFLNNLNVAAVVKDETIRAQLHDVFTALPHISADIFIGSPASARDEALQKASLLLIQVSRGDMISEEVIAHLTLSETGDERPVIVIADSLEDKQMVQLLRQGVRDFLPLPLVAEEVAGALSRLARPEKKSAAADPEKSKVITFVHAAGGMGASTLAVNTATLINGTEKDGIKDGIKDGKACLLDLDLQYGSSSIHLDLPGHSPVVDIVEKPDRLDRDMFEAMMVRHESGLRVLTTPMTPLPLEALSDRIVGRLLHIARARYPYVIIDMPQTMTHWTDTVLKSSDVIYLTLQLNVPAIRQARRWFDALAQEGLHHLPIKIVVNRHVPLSRIRHDTISIAQAAEALGRKIDHLIPNDFELISQSLDQGMPAVSIGPNSKFTKQLQDMLADLTAAVATPPRQKLWDKLWA